MTRTVVAGYRELRDEVFAMNNELLTILAALRRRKRAPLPGRRRRIRRGNYLTGLRVRVPGSGLGANTYGREIDYTDRGGD